VSINKWDKRFISLAHHISEWSRDPSTRVGAVITTSSNRIVSVGYNGFPRGVDDREERYNERETKYKMVVHAEMNAILFAQHSLLGNTIYTYPFPPCSRCAGVVIQSGIDRVVSLPPLGVALERWGDDFEVAKKMFLEARVRYCIGEWL